MRHSVTFAGLPVVLVPLLALATVLRLKFEVNELEARAAASVRHPNVASVFHLGRSAEGYFYAMEFVEGETLQHLIKRSGRLEVKLALDIATQVAEILREARAAASVRHPNVASVFHVGRKGATTDKVRTPK